MGRRRDESRTRQNRTRGYPGGGYDRPGYGGGERRGERGNEYPDEGLYGPYFDRRGNRYFEDPRGRRYYDDDFAEPYYPDYSRDRYERDHRRDAGRTAVKGLVAVAVILVLIVGMIMVTNDFTGGPSESAQQAPAQAPQQQPVQPQPEDFTPEAPAPQAPAQPQAPADPNPGGASSEQVEGMRADINRQLAEIRQSLNQLRLEIWGLFTSQQNEQQEGSP